MSAAWLIIFIAILRLFIWTGITIFRIIAFVLFAPFFPRRQPRARRPRARRVVEVVPRVARAPREYGNEGVLFDFLARQFGYARVAEPPTSLAAPAPAQRRAHAYAPPQPEYVPTRNEVDLERALVQMGWPRARARQITSQVVNELGANADLDAMVKRGLQLGR